LFDFTNVFMTAIAAWNVLHRCTMLRVAQGPTDAAARRWSIALGFAVLAGCCAAISCASPTLPLPPPEAPMQTDGIDADHVQLSAGCGGAQGQALIVIVNENVAPDMAVGGAIATDCGSWDSSVLAHSGDALSITQTADESTSPPATYIVR
jgi:hypothetical protein